MLLATVIGIVFTSGGLALSYTPDLPAGATMIVLAGAIYLVALLTKGLLTKYGNKPKQTDY
jgi:zinc transport system permease protein